MELPYSEGTVFLVPLTNGRYARGVVARAAPKGKILLGYFFGPRLVTVDNVSLMDLHPENAITRLRFGDLGLVNEEWPICGKLPEWDRSQWPMPEVVRRDDQSRRAWLVQYADDNPGNVVAEYPVDYELPYESDSLFGHIAVQILLTKLLGDAPLNDHEKELESSPPLSKDEPHEPIHHYLYFPDKRTGKRVANILRKEGFTVDDRLGADDINWLVLAKSNAAPTGGTIENQGRMLQKIAEENNGEYDGWEADVNN